MRLRACVCGAGPRWRTRIWRQCCPGSIGPSPPSRRRCSAPSRPDAARSKARSVGRALVHRPVRLGTQAPPWRECHSGVFCVHRSCAVQQRIRPRNHTYTAAFLHQCVRSDAGCGLASLTMVIHRTVDKVVDNPVEPSVAPIRKPQWPKPGRFARRVAERAARIPG